MATASPVEMDSSRAEAFAERMLGAVNSATLMLMTSMGHRTGLFDVLSGMEPATCGEIAAASGLNERYVREWLGAMVAGRVTEYAPTTQKYNLPAEHAAFLTRAAGCDNIASVAQWIAVLGSVEDRVVDCFHNGGGVSYCCYDRFHEVMAEESAQTVVAALSDHILPLVPELKSRLEQGIDVLDIGCGSGRAMNAMAGMFPNSRFVGCDFSEEAIGRGRQQAAEAGLSNVRFEQQDVSALPFESDFDLITAFDAIHDQAKPDVVLDRISGALRNDGVFLMQDIAASSHVEKNIENPLGAMLYTISCMHCMTVSLAQDGAGLGAVWGEELALKMLADAGFGNVDLQRLPHDIMNNYYIARKA